MGIGFNAGHSAVALLEHAPKGSSLLSLDLGWHGYTRPLEEAVSTIVAGRGHKHTLRIEDSAVALPKLMHDNFDLIFIDGNHLYEATKVDLWLCSQLAAQDTVLLVNHVF